MVRYRVLERLTSWSMVLLVWGGSGKSGKEGEECGPERRLGANPVS